MEPLGQPVADGVFEPVNVEDVGDDEAGQRRLAPDDVFGFIAHPAPDGIATMQSCAVLASQLCRHLNASRACFAQCMYMMFYQACREK